MTVIERFLKYVRQETRSFQPKPGEKQEHPSSSGQRALLVDLQLELVKMGVPFSNEGDCFLDLGDGSFLVVLPPTPGCEEAPHVVYAAHMDTYFGCPGGATPIVHHYTGGDIVLPKDGTVIPASDLIGLVGKRIITASGDTLLGGDDKAGVASLMALIETLMTEQTPHGPLTFWFCTDEEIGEVGVAFLPAGIVATWDFFWTVDGERLDTVDVGCFYGAKVNVEFRGNDCHPGVDGPKLKPAHYAAARFLDKLGDVPTPWKTADEESFIYVPAFPAGTAGKTQVSVYPRTFRPEEFPALAATIKQVAVEAAEHYGVEAVVGDTEVMYVSTEVAIDANRRLLVPGLDALKEVGVTPKLHRVRAGTDGAMLNMTYPQIPAPNLGTGARNLHGVREFVVADELELVPGILKSMVVSYSTMKRKW